MAPGGACNAYASNPVTCVMSGNDTRLRDNSTILSQRAAGHRRSNSRRKRAAWSAGVNGFDGLPFEAETKIVCVAPDFSFRHDAGRHRFRRGRLFDLGIDLAAHALLDRLHR